MSTKTRNPWAALDTTHQEATRRILSVWESADESALVQGREWYGVAFGTALEVSARGGVSVQAAAAVIAHLSPRTSWARNVAGALALVATDEAPHCMSANVDRARKALAAEDPAETFGPGALKTRAFYANILGDEQAVTVDVWALKAAGVDPKANLKAVGAYQAVADAYREAARVAGVTPAVMQATTWVAVRGRSN